MVEFDVKSPRIRRAVPSAPGVLGGTSDEGEEDEEEPNIEEGFGRVADFLCSIE
jgi:hypothetical protein